MSAFIVSDEHLNYIINYAIQQKLNIPTNTDWQPAYKAAKDTIRVLYSENASSIHSRYPGRQATDTTPTFRMNVLRKFDPVQVIKACDCYNYQASESIDYDNSLARKIITSIREHAISMLPGYAEAAWDISDIVAMAENAEARS